MKWFCDGAHMVVCPYCIENNKATLTNDCKTFFYCNRRFLPSYHQYKKKITEKTSSKIKLKGMLHL
jgi:hypothetical protein